MTKDGATTVKYSISIYRRRDTAASRSARVFLGFGSAGAWLWWVFQRVGQERLHLAAGWT
eukprot:5534946-Amphidinium_carterae.1